MTTMVQWSFCFCTQHNRKNKFIVFVLFHNTTHKSEENVISSALVHWFSRGTVTSAQRLFCNPFLSKKPFALTREWCGGKGSLSVINIHPSGRPPNLLLVILNKTDFTASHSWWSDDGRSHCEKYKSQKFIHLEWKFKLWTPQNSHLSARHQARKSSCWKDSHCPWESPCPLKRNVDWYHHWPFSMCALWDYRADRSKAPALRTPLSIHVNGFPPQITAGWWRSK